LFYIRQHIYPDQTYGNKICSWYIATFGEITLKSNMIPAIKKQPALTLLFCLLAVSLPLGAFAASPQQNSATPAESSTGWQQLAPGLQLGVFRSPQPSESGDSIVRVLRIDPQHYKFRLLNASAVKNGRALSARDWSRRYGLTAAINASMYQADYRASVSLMRTRGHVNNPRLSKDMTVLAFDRLDAKVPPVKIIDRQCDDFNLWQRKYGTLIQSIRMISCSGKNVWHPQPQQWSTAAIATDQRNRVLFIHCGSPYSTHDLINILKALPLDISRAMYTEGGPQAQLYIKSGRHEYEFAGPFQLNRRQNSKAFFSPPIPNVVGIAPWPDSQK